MGPFRIFVVIRKLNTGKQVALSKTEKTFMLNNKEIMVTACS